VRPEQPDLVVEKAPSGAGQWQVDVTTQAPGARPRARKPEAFRRFGLSEAATTAHLNEVFRTL